MSSNSAMTRPTLRRVTNAIAIITFIALANLVRFKCGLKWWNSLEEIEGPVTVLVVELGRICRGAFLQRSGEKFSFGLGYSVIWGIVTAYWMFVKVFV